MYFFFKKLIVFFVVLSTIIANDNEIKCHIDQENPIEELKSKNKKTHYNYNNLNIIIFIFMVFITFILTKCILWIINKENTAFHHLNCLDDSLQKIIKTIDNNQKNYHIYKKNNSSIMKNLNDLKTNHGNFHNKTMEIFNSLSNTIHRKSHEYSNILSHDNNEEKLLIIKTIESIYHNIYNNCNLKKINLGNYEIEITKNFINIIQNKSFFIKFSSQGYSINENPLWSLNKIPSSTQFIKLNQNQLIILRNFIYKINEDFNHYINNYKNKLKIIKKIHKILNHFNQENIYFFSKGYMKNYHKNIDIFNTDHEKILNVNYNCHDIRVIIEDLQQQQSLIDLDYEELINIYNDFQYGLNEYNNKKAIINDIQNIFIKIQYENSIKINYEQYSIEYNKEKQYLSIVKNNHLMGYIQREKIYVINNQLLEIFNLNTINNNENYSQFNSKELKYIKNILNNLYSIIKNENRENSIIKKLYLLIDEIQRQQKDIQEYKEKYQELLNKFSESTKKNSADINNLYNKYEQNINDLKKDYQYRINYIENENKKLEKDKISLKNQYDNLNKQLWEIDEQKILIEAKYNLLKKDYNNLLKQNENILEKKQNENIVEKKQNLLNQSEEKSIINISNDQKNHLLDDIKKIFYIIKNILLDDEFITVYTVNNIGEYKIIGYEDNDTFIFQCRSVEDKLFWSLDNNLNFIVYNIDITKNIFNLTINNLMMVNDLKDWDKNMALPKIIPLSNYNYNTLKTIYNVLNNIIEEYSGQKVYLKKIEELPIKSMIESWENSFMNENENFIYEDGDYSIKCQNSQLNLYYKNYDGYQSFSQDTTVNETKIGEISDNAILLEDIEYLNNLKTFFDINDAIDIKYPCVNFKEMKSNVLEKIYDKLRQFNTINI